MRVTTRDGVTPTLRVWIARLKRMDPALKRIGHYAVEVSRESFARTADPVTGQPWPRLSAATLKRRRGITAAILRDTSELYKSLLYRITGRRSVAIGAAAVHGQYHQTGTRNVPRRRHIGIDARAHRKIGDMVLEYLERGR